LPDSEILTQIKDYSVSSRDRPNLSLVDYARLKSGTVEVKGRSVPSSPLSSFKVAKEVAEELKKWIEKGSFLLSRPVELVADRREYKPMRAGTLRLRVKDVMAVRVAVARPGLTVRAAASLMQERGVDHLPVVDEAGKLTGIVTSWDISKAVALGSDDLQSVTTKEVISFREEDAIDEVADRLLAHGISGGPVVDGTSKVVGLVTLSDITKPSVRRRK
jgi:CBS domain-containing protein